PERLIKIDVGSRVVQDEPVAMGKHEGEQESLFVTHQQLRSQSHPYYRAVNRVLGEHGFDRYVEKLCARFYAKKMGRPGLAPGVYFRSLLLGFFEGIDSERGIAWRAADSLSLRDFLGIPTTKQTPDHSTISRTRRLIDVETHQAVFTWVLSVLDGAGLIKGKTIGVDATTLEANAAMRSIVRRDDGRTYQTFLEDLARASGIETPTREDLARLDRKRKKKGSNDDWYNPNDPDAKITKMKDGRTHLAHKEEQAVDMDTGAVVAVTIGPATAGDTATIEGTLDAAVQNLDDARELAGDESQREGDPEEAVGDKGYHSKMVLLSLAQEGWRTYIAEPQRGRQKWADQAAEQAAVYANRRRKNGRRGRALMRLRGELLERPFAHAFETGGMRRTHLREHENIAKRLLVHVAGVNLALLMRTRFGVGKPRCLQGRPAAFAAALIAFLRWLCLPVRLLLDSSGPGWRPELIAQSS
ncbi:MAG TPA: transposase, partial [Vicinamibacterales bacterium]|nr:transposase [Vicinamibacterales bacterium]